MDVVMAVSSTLEGFLHEHFDKSAIAPARHDSSALPELHNHLYGCDHHHAISRTLKSCNIHESGTGRRTSLTSRSTTDFTQNT